MWRAHQIALTDAGRLIVRLAGELTAAAAAHVDRDLRASSYLARHVDVVVDLRQLERCEPGARAILVDVHRLCADGGRRSAYVADVPLFRGLALWIAHVTGDQHSRAVGTMAQAKAWLRASELRLARTVRLLQLARARAKGAKRG